MISLDRYLLATNGQSLAGIQTWQFSNPLPYKEGLSENVYHDLFEQIERDESLQQNFFINRAAGIKDKAVLLLMIQLPSQHIQTIFLMYDIGLIKLLIDGLPTIKVLTLYSIETRQPIAFTKRPGNLPDVVTIESALKQLAILGLVNSEIVTDNGYYYEQNLADILYSREREIKIFMSLSITY